MTLRFAIPSKGSLYDGTLAFLEGCGLKVSRPNPRRYTAGIRALPAAEVLLHRPPDIIEKTRARYHEAFQRLTGRDLLRP